MKYVRAALKLAAETALISTVGSFFWMALGRQVVTQTVGGGVEIAGGGLTFWHFFVGIVQLYLLYRLIQWVIGFIAKKTARKVDSGLRDVRGYGEVRDRMVNIFEDRPRSGGAGRSSSRNTPASYFRNRER